MTLRRRFRLWLLVLVELSFAAVSVATEQFWMLLIAGPITALSWYVVEGPREKGLPRWGGNIGAILLMCLVLVTVLADPNPGRTMEYLGSFVLGLLVLRQWQQRSCREDAQQIVLSLVLVLSSAMQSEKLLFGIILLLWTVVVIYVAILFQLYAGTTRARDLRQGGLQSNLRMVPPLMARFGPLDLKSVRRTAAIAFFGLMIFSILIFIIFPRNILFKSQMPGRGTNLRSGFVENVDLVTNRRITESRREVFSLQWKDASGEAIEWSKPILLRGAVLTQYDPMLDRWTAPSSRFVQSRTIQPALDGAFTSLGIRAAEEHFQTYTVLVTMRSLTSNVVFAPWVPIELSATEGRTFQIDPTSLIITDLGVDIMGSYWSYGLKVQPFPSSATVEGLMGNADPPEEDVSFPIPEIAVIAREALEEESIDFEIQPDEDRWLRNRRVARGLANWLEKNHIYKTDLGSFIQRAGEDPIVSFLQRYKFGHCEYFASALTAMCRSIGIEARLVTGYVALEYDRRTASYIVREANAHAWTEVRIGAYKWDTLDPSPRSELEAIQARNESWADGWRWMYDRLDFLWNSSIVGFDTRTQAMLAKRASSGWNEKGEGLFARGLDGLRSINRFFKLGPAGYIWMASIGVLAIAFLITGIALVRRRRQIVQRIRLNTSNPDRARMLVRQLGFWADALRVMERRGLKKTRSETPLAYSQRAAAVDPEAGKLLGSLVELMYRIRFGGYEPEQKELDQANALVKTLRAGVVAS